MRWIMAIVLSAGLGVLFYSRGQAAETPSARFAHHIVDREGPLDPWLKSVGDLNHDGKPDLLAGGRGKGGLVWYRNPDWKKSQIAAGSFGTDGEVADIDGDRDADVVAINAEPSGLSWYANPGWERHVISDLQLHDIELCDFDKDGDIDVVARDQGSFGAKGDLIYFFRHDPEDKWALSTMPITSGEGLRLDDMDGDGDMDLIIERVWYENTGDPSALAWLRHEYGGAWNYPFAFVATGQINSDRRPDIVLSPAERAGTWYRLSWFESPRNPKSDPWREHVVDSKVEAVHHFVGAADFNGDGKADIATAQMEQGSDPDEVKIYLNPGRGKVWQKVVIATGGSHSMRIADIDGDGDMDLYGANWRGTTKYEWWENVLK